MLRKLHGETTVHVSFVEVRTRRLTGGNTDPSAESDSVSRASAPSPTWSSRRGESAVQIVQEEIRDLLAVSVRKHAPRTRSVALKMCVDYSVTGRLGIGPSSSGCTGATRDGVTMQERDPRRRSGPGGHYGATCAGL